MFSVTLRSLYAENVGNAKYLLSEVYFYVPTVIGADETATVLDVLRQFRRGRRVTVDVALLQSVSRIR